MKKTRHGVAHVTETGGNVFADLGFSKSEAAKLKARSDELVKTRLAMREHLAEEIAGWIKSENLLQEDAARILNVARPRVSEVVRKKINKFSLEKLVEMLGRAGKRVELVVKEAA